MNNLQFMNKLKINQSSNNKSVITKINQPSNNQPSNNQSSNNQSSNVQSSNNQSSNNQSSNNQSSNNQSSNNQSSNVRSSNNQSSNNQLKSDKYNPDVNTNYEKISSTRSQTTFSYSTDIWKPIIGSIDKTDIKTNDLKINIDKPNYDQIKNNYEQIVKQRQIEKENSIKIIKDYHTINNSIELDKNTLDNNDNSFLELKDNSKKISSNNSNIDMDTLLKSMSKLDDIMNSINNL
jgi:hypothetical protein